MRAQDIVENPEQDVKKVILDQDNPDISVLVGTNIPQDIEEQLTNFLKCRMSTFAWKHEDMTGISKDIITHKLGIDRSFKPIETKMNRRSHFPQRVFFRNGNDGISKRMFISSTDKSSETKNEQTESFSSTSILQKWK